MKPSVKIQHEPTLGETARLEAEILHADAERMVQQLKQVTRFPWKRFSLVILILLALIAAVYEYQHRKVQVLHGQLDQLRTQLENREISTSEVISQRSDQLQARHDVLAVTVQNTQQQVIELSKQFTELKQRETRLSNQLAQVLQTEALLSQAQLQLEPISQQVSQLVESFTLQENQQQDLANQLKLLQQSMEQQQTESASAKQLAKLERKLVDVEGHFSALQQQQAQDQQKLDKLNTQPKTSVDKAALHRIEQELLVLKMDMEAASNNTQGAHHQMKSDEFDAFRAETHRRLLELEAR